MDDESRVKILRLLGRIYTPIAADDLDMCVDLTEGLHIGEEQLVELLAADRAEFLSGITRPVWACPALEVRGGGANDEFFTRSDWPVWA
ncbi:hypothetical protein [Pseudofrankia sp. DC12]|uniref:hypothetical protein n=1 Tax=Pseudofrankia sp. DC12 TaxID=683315 RepID=UPI0005F84F75|nr:hypothetical protein [Pseudofrankia sp. DC12]